VYALSKFATNGIMSPLEPYLLIKQIQIMIDAKMSANTKKIPF